MIDSLLILLDCPLVHAALHRSRLNFQSKKEKKCLCCYPPESLCQAVASGDYNYVGSASVSICFVTAQ